MSDIDIDSHVPGPPGKTTPPDLLDGIANPKPVKEQTKITFAQIPVFDKTPPKVAMTLEECTHIEYVIKFRKLETPQQVINVLGKLGKDTRIEVVFKRVNGNTFMPSIGIAVYENVKEIFTDRLASPKKFHYYLELETLFDASYLMSKKANKHLIELGLLTKEPKKTKKTTK